MDKRDGKHSTKERFKKRAVEMEESQKTTMRGKGEEG